MYIEKYPMGIINVDVYFEKNIGYLIGNELCSKSGHATMSGMSCMFGLDMQLSRVGLHVGVGHRTR